MAWTVLSLMNARAELSTTLVAMVALAAMDMS
jgi:hypothetical protein